MGGIIGNFGKKMVSTLQELETNHATKSYYRRLAMDEDYQAAYVAANMQRENGYLLQSARERALAIYQKYRQTEAAQKVGLAASGLRQDSSTVQQLLKNSRFQALLDEQAMQNNLKGQIYENNVDTAEQIRALNKLANDHRRKAMQSKSMWKLGFSLLDWFSAF